MKKLMVFALAAILLVSSFGCSSKKTAGDGEIPVIKVFSDIDYTTEGNQAWIKYAEEQCGIKLEFESPPSTSYKERLQIMLASGDYPDLILFKDPGDAEFTTAIDSGIVAPLDDYVDSLKNLQKHTYDYAWDAMRKEGKGSIYGVPRSTLVRTDGFIIRKDWLDKVGIPVPEDRTLTLDEFYTILDKFTNEDPDGNGKKDTYGIATYSDTNKGLILPVTETFDLFGWQKAKKDDYKYMNPMYSKKADNYKKALEFNQKLFKEGLVDPESPVINTYVNMTERFKRGIVGVVREFGGRFTQYEEQINQLFPEAELCMVNSITDENGDTKAPTDYNSGCYGLWAISETNENKEATLKFLDWIVSDEAWETSMYGIEGVAYNVVDGEKVFEDVKYGIGRSITRRNTDVDFYIPGGSEPEDVELMRELMHEQMENSVMSLDRGYKPAAASQPKYMDYQTKMIQEVTKILLGEKEVSYYDKVLDGWYKNGGTEYVEEMNEYIKNIEKASK